MPDKDSLPSRGISFRALVDANGVAVGGTATIAQLRQRGMQPVCQVDSSGVHSGGLTQAQLRSRGIPVFCEVDGVGAATGATLAQLRSRGIPAACMLDANGVAQGGTATITQLRQRGIPYFCPLDENGDETTLAGGGDVTPPTITSAATANCAENATLSHSLTADEAVTWSIVGGADQARFEISVATLRWLSNGTKDFEAPDDVGSNNTYVVDVRATDTALNTSDQTITITVTDVNEAVNITLTDNSVDATDQTTYTFSSQAFGAAASDRKMVVGVGARGSGTFSISSVTIGGVAATVVADSPGGAVQNHAALAVADVPSGTTGNVVIVLSAGATRCGIGVWRMVGASTSTPTDTGISSTDPATTTLTIGANGGGVGYGLKVEGPETMTWTGLTEDFDEVVEASITHTGASLNSVAGGDISVSGEWSGVSGTQFAAFASWPN